MEERNIRLLKRSAPSAVRLILLLGALTSLWGMARRLEAWEESYANTFEFDIPFWLSAIGLGILSGALFGLAVWLPMRWRGYRAGPVLILGLPPALLLARTPFLFGWALPRGWDVPSIINREWPFDALAPHFALAVMLGVVIVAGFGLPRPALTRRQGERTSPEGAGSPA